MSVKETARLLCSWLNGKPDPQTPPGEIEAVANATGADAGGIRGQIRFVLQVVSGG